MNSVWMDRVGGVASATCAVHCLALGFAPALLSVLGLGALAHEAFEWVFFGTAVVLAVLAATLGYRVHRTRWVLAGFGAGLLVLLAGRLGEALALYEGGAGLAILGGTLLVGSHLASLRRLRMCREARCS